MPPWVPQICTLKDTSLQQAAWERTSLPGIQVRWLVTQQTGESHRNQACLGAGIGVMAAGGLLAEVEWHPMEMMGNLCLIPNRTQAWLCPVTSWRFLVYTPCARKDSVV